MARAGRSRAPRSTCGRRSGASSRWRRTGRTCTTNTRSLPGPVLAGMERARRVGGAGTPAVAEFASAELGVLMGTSSVAADHLIRDALDLRHRHPVLWAALGDGQGQGVEGAEGGAADPRRRPVAGAGPRGGRRGDPVCGGVGVEAVHRPGRRPDHRGRPRRRGGPAGGGVAGPVRDHRAVGRVRAQDPDREGHRGGRDLLRRDVRPDRPMPRRGWGHRPGRRPPVQGGRDPGPAGARVGAAAAARRRRTRRRGRAGLDEPAEPPGCRSARPAAAPTATPRRPAVPGGPGPAPPPGHPLRPDQRGVAAVRDRGRGLRRHPGRRHRRRGHRAAGDGAARALPRHRPPGAGPARPAPGRRPRDPHPDAGSPQAVPALEVFPFSHTAPNPTSTTPSPTSRRTAVAHRGRPAPTTSGR